MKLTLPFDSALSYTITQTYQQHAAYKAAKKLTNYNGGIDYYFYDQPVGTPIKPAAPGVVTFAGWDTAKKEDGTPGGYGLHVRIRHADGTVTIYAHLSAVHVAAGQAVADGEVIGESGNTGNSTGPHLHFEVRTPAGVAVDPQGYLDAPPITPPTGGSSTAIKKGDRVRVDAKSVNERLKPDKSSLDMGDVLQGEEITAAGDEVVGAGGIRFVPVEKVVTVFVATGEGKNRYLSKI